MSTDADWADYFDTTDRPYVEDLDLGGTWLIELAVTVDFLRRGDRPGLTVWDALEEALRWWIDEQAGATGGAPNAEHEPQGASLDRTLVQALELLEPDPRTNAAVAIQQAIRRWLDVTGARLDQSEPIGTPR